jgi:hypothetical protein
VHFPPTSGSWLNLVEVFFSIITRQAIRRGSFDNVKQLVAAIRAFIDAYNDRCRPVVWTKKPDDIMPRATRQPTQPVNQLQTRDTSVLRPREGLCRLPRCVPGGVRARDPGEHKRRVSRTRARGRRIWARPFGRHWPIVGERRDVLPPQLLRVGVKFADGRTATSIGGHDRPVGGPVMDALRGGGRGGSGDSHFHQGYWISPLPSPGPVAIVCEWPAVQIAVARHRIDAQVMFDAAEKSRSMLGDGHQVLKDGRSWRLGTSADAAWIDEGTSAGTTITLAIPPIYESYCTLEVPPNYTTELARHEQVVIELLAEQTPDQPWWLGYLDTGASDIVFPYAPRTTMYYGYGYVLVEAGPQQAASWREEPFNWTLPELMFPTDRSWLSRPCGTTPGRLSAAPNSS